MGIGLTEDGQPRHAATERTGTAHGSATPLKPSCDSTPGIAGFVFRGTEHRLATSWTADAVFIAQEFVHAAATARLCGAYYPVAGIGRDRGAQMRGPAAGTLLRGHTEIASISR